jgi:DNA-directed RNA polymerase subunit A"
MKMSKRKLTQDEIHDITSKLSVIGPKHFKASIHDNIIKNLVHQLQQVELYPDMYDKFLNKIVESYYKSHVSPGENVGILTAQSIGEKQTQMSLSFKESVYIKYKGELMNVRIGKFINDLFKQKYDKVIRLDEDSWILDTMDDDISTFSVDKHGNVKWSKITCLSKHAPNGDLAEITTIAGKKVVCTYSHSLLTKHPDLGYIIPVKTSDAIIGTQIPVLNKFDMFKSTKTLLYNTATVCGLFFKYGYIRGPNTHFKYTTNDEYNILYSFAQRNMIDCDSVDHELVYKDFIPCKSASIPLYILSHGSYQDVEEFIHTLTYIRKRKRIVDYVHFQFLHDVELLLHVIGYVNYTIHSDACKIVLSSSIAHDTNVLNSIVWDTVSNIKNISETIYTQLYDHVYDFSVGDDETFMLTNGVFVHNTLNSVIGEELIHYYDSMGVNHITTIGYFIDTCMAKSKDLIKYIPENNTEYLSLSNPIKILGVTEKGQVEWSTVTGITRHDIAPGDLVKIETRLGRTVVATKYKSFFTRTDNKLVQQDREVRLGDIIPIVQKSPFIEDNTTSNWQGYDLDWDLGYMLSMYYTRGHTSDFRTLIRTSDKSTQTRIVHFAKKYGYKYVDFYNGVYIFSHHLYQSLHNLSDIIPPFLFSAPCECIKGFLYGIFHEKSVYNTDSNILQLCIAELLNKFGIISQISKHSIAIINMVDYTSAIIKNEIVMRYDLDDKIPGILTCTHNGTMSRKSLYKIIPSSTVEKQIINQTINQTVYYDMIVKITPIHKSQKVYDLTVNNKTFSLLGGTLVYDTFHTAGLTVKTVVSGVPRFMELMNTTKEPKSASCFIKMPISDTIKSIFDIRNYIGDKLRCLQLTRVLYDYTIVSFKDIKMDWWIQDELIPVSILDEDRVLRLQLSHKLIYEYRCSLTSIVNKINSVFIDVYAVCSSLNECIIDVFILNKDGISLEKQISYVTEENKFDIFLEEIVLTKFEKFIISGVEKINDYMISTIKPGHEWLISTQGSNLKTLMELDLFEFNNVMSNNMWEIYNLLGIEAAREFLIREFTDVISSDGTFINKCHILLLVDTMTCKGDITSISRYSLRSKSSVLSRSSFEESIENFLKSGIFSEIDKMTSVSSNIMTGKLSRVGTGICDIMMSDNVFEKSEAIPTHSIYNIDHEIDENLSILDILPTIFE